MNEKRRKEESVINRNISTNNIQNKKSKNIDKSKHTKFFLRKIKYLYIKKFNKKNKKNRKLIFNNITNTNNIFIKKSIEQNLNPKNLFEFIKKSKKN